VLGVGLLIAGGACTDRALDLPGVGAFAAPDLATADFARSDLALSDFAPADLALSDLAQDNAHDLITPDLLRNCSGVIVTTLAGNGIPGDVDGTGGLNGTTEFHFPTGIAVDANGAVYVGDTYNERIRKLAPDGTTTTLTGNGMIGYVDGTGGRNGTTEFLDVYGLAIDSTGTLFMADSGGGSIRQVAPDGSTSTLAGNGGAGSVDGSGGRNGTTEFHFAIGVALDGAGNVLIGETNGNRIRKVAPDGTTTTLAGNGIAGWGDGTGGANGTSEFRAPVGVAVDGAGNVFVADAGNHRIRRVAASGSTTTVAGNGIAGLADGSPGISGTAEFNHPSGIAIDSAGNLYIADSGNHAIRQISPDGTTTTLAGGLGAGFRDGDRCSAMFNNPFMIAVQGKVLFVTDEFNWRVRKIQLP
jgi:sugar lactone lactonase YvrE